MWSATCSVAGMFGDTEGAGAAWPRRGTPARILSACSAVHCLVHACQSIVVWVVCRPGLVCSLSIPLQLWQPVHTMLQLRCTCRMCWVLL